MTLAGRLLSAASLALAAAMLSAQPLPPGQMAASTPRELGTVAGIVRLSDEPVAGAVVTLAGAGLVPPRAAITDINGFFGFANLAPGDYGLAVRKSPFVLSTVGGVAWMGDEIPVSVTAGQRIDLSLVLARGGAIEGIIRDPFGQPLSGATVSVFSRRRDLSSPSGPPVTSATTDNRGRYRAYGLRTAEYVVHASARTSSGSLGVELVDDGDFRVLERAARESRAFSLPQRTEQQTVQYSPTYFGGTSFESDAGAVTIAAGLEQAGIDIQLGLAQTVTLRGLVTTSDGRPATASRVSLLPDQPGVELSGSTVVAVDASGGFVKESVAPGRYRLVAQAVSPAGGNAIESASVDIQVPGSDYSNVRMVLARPLRIEGRLLFDDAGRPMPPMSLNSARVTLRRVGNGIRVSSLDVARATVRETGSFEIENILPGNYAVTVEFPADPGTDPPGLEFIQMGGARIVDGIVAVVESSNGVLELHVATQQAELSGTVTGWSRGVAGSLSVLVFPADAAWRRSSDRVRIVQVQESGSYRVRALPVGAYLVVLVSGVDLSGFFTLSTFEEFERMAARVQLGQAERRTLDFRVDKR